MNGSGWERGRAAGEAQPRSARPGTGGGVYAPALEHQEQRLAPTGRGGKRLTTGSYWSPSPGGAFNLVNNKVEAFNLAFNLPLECFQPY